MRPNVSPSLRPVNPPEYFDTLRLTFVFGQAHSNPCPSESIFGWRRPFRRGLLSFTGGLRLFLVSHESINYCVCPASPGIATSGNRPHRGIAVHQNLSQPAVTGPRDGRPGCHSRGWKILSLPDVQYARLRSVCFGGPHPLGSQRSRI